MNKKWKIIRAFVNLVSNPGNTNLIFQLQSALHNTTTSKERQLLLNKYKTTSSVIKMLEDYYLPQPYTQQELSKYAPGTFGYSYYQHLHKNRFSSNFFPIEPPFDELNYFEVRMNQTHDLLHVLTGFGVSIEDEVGLQAFYVSQTQDIFSLWLIAASLLYTSFYDQSLVTPMLQALVVGWTNGKEALPLQAVHWEELWSKSLKEIRAIYNIVPASSIYDFDN